MSGARRAAASSGGKAPGSVAPRASASASGRSAAGSGTIAASATGSPSRPSAVMRLAPTASAARNGQGVSPAIGSAPVSAESRPATPCSATSPAKATGPPPPKPVSRACVTVSVPRRGSGRVMRLSARVIAAIATARRGDGARAVPGSGAGPSGRGAARKTQFGAPSAVRSSRMSAPSMAMARISTAPRSSGSSATCTSSRRIVAISGRLPPGRFASVAPSTVTAGTSPGRSETAPSVAMRPVAPSIAAAMRGVRLPDPIAATSA
ncbi:hypothetical protein ROS9278_04695 [Roseomonas sp. CECT 9278]|nr:hypothetical protein ROS9278_04695 [Roseomonas sp. CECT 9278]